MGLKLVRTGGLTLINNMLWSGQVADLQDTAPDTTVLRVLARHIDGGDCLHGALAIVGDSLSFAVKR